MGGALLVHHFQGMEEVWGLGRNRSYLREVGVYSQGRWRGLRASGEMGRRGEGQQWEEEKLWEGKGGDFLH